MVSTEQFKKAMERIYNKVVEEKEILVNHDIPVTGKAEEENIDNLLLKAKDTNFKLLIMGRFSSGKSCFVNMLLGEKLLPEKALPTTAIITELYYGEKKQVVVYPKPGKWKGGDAPFEIEPTLNEIKKYATINNSKGLNKKEANRVDSLFEKMVVFWPLEILKEGVCIIDSPGTDDPYNNDYIVEAYVPKVDAVLYCINGTNAYSDMDKRTLTMLDGKGFKNIIIVTTYFDVVTDGLDEEEIKEFVDTTYNAFYSNHTEKKFCHYVSSIDGFCAKQENDHGKFVESGCFELEKFLGEFLTEYKGREKISVASFSVKAFNKTAKERIEGIIDNLDVPLAEFDQKITKAKANLEQAKKEGDLLSKEFKLQLKQAREKTDELIPGLYQELYDNISLEGFEPNTSFTMFHPKESSQMIADECAQEITTRNKMKVNTWSTEVLEPEIGKALGDVYKKMEHQFKNFESDIENATSSLVPKIEQVNTNVKTGTKVGMFAYALFTGDWVTALLGGVFGAGAFGKTLLCQLAAGMILGIAALFTPIGLAAVVIAALGALFLGVSWNVATAADSIKKSTVKQARKSVEKDKEKIMEGIKEQLGSIFNQMEERLNQAIAEDLEKTRETLKLIEEERKNNAGRIEGRKADLRKVLSFVESADKEMDDIRREFRI